MQQKKQIVFLHVPKTAGQSVRIFLGNAFPKRLMFPGQTDNHLALYSRNELNHYDIFCGHFSWSLLDCLRPDAFVFTILRDPVERLFSFYKYLRRQGASMSHEQLSEPQHVGIRLATELALDDYLSAQDPLHRGFLLNNLDNFYMYYFSTRCMNGRQLIRDVYPESDTFTSEKVLQIAIRNMSEKLNVYSLESLQQFTSDLVGEEGFIQTDFPRANPDDSGSSPSLVSLCREHGKALTLLHLFCQYDMKLYQQFCL